MRTIFRQVMGWFFIVLGVVGLFLPVLQGILFLAVGFLLLSRDIPVFRRLVIWFKKKYPAMRKPLKGFNSWLGKKKRKFSSKL